MTEHDGDLPVEPAADDLPVEPAASEDLPAEPATSGDPAVEPPAATDDPLARLRQRAARHAPASEPVADPEPSDPAAAPLPHGPATPPAVADLPAPAGPAEQVGPAEPAEPVVSAPEEKPAEPAAAVTPVGADETAAEPAVTGRRGLRGMSRTAAVLAALAVLAAALTAVAAAATVKFSGNRTTTEASTSSGRAAIIAAAVSGVTATASYNWQTLDADQRAAESQLAEPFRTSYAQRFQAQVAPLARKYHATAKASVDPKFGAGLVSVTGGHANVLLYVDQVVTNKQLSAPRLDQTRVFATLVQVDGRWRIAGLRTL